MIKLTKIYKDLIKENLLGEEYSNGILYGYHVTTNNDETLDAIKNNGFSIGSGDMEGRGFYAFYDLDRAAGYSSKDGATNRIIKFKISDMSKILILDIDLAKEILGSENYHIHMQLDKIFTIEKCYSDCKKVTTDLYPTIDDYINRLLEIEKTYYATVGAEFFTMHTLDFESSVNVINYGQYGLQYRINDIEIAKPIGYYDLKPFEKSIINYTEFK